jgi:hypothetical protein
MFSMTQRFIRTLAVMAVLTVAGMIMGGTLAWIKLGRTSMIPVTTQVQKGVRLEIDSLLRDMTLEEVAKEADLIILGTVTGPPKSRWNTPSGALPAGVPLAELPIGTYIFTDTPVKVNRYLKGNRTDSTVLVRTRGGTLGPDTTGAEDEGHLKVGQPVVLFLKSQDVETGDIGPEHYIIIEGYQGLYDIVGNRAVSKFKELPLTDLLTRVSRTN